MNASSYSDTMNKGLKYFGYFSIAIGVAIGLGLATAVAVIVSYTT